MKKRREVTSSYLVFARTSQASEAVRGSLCFSCLSQCLSSQPVRIPSPAPLAVFQLLPTARSPLL